MVWKGAMWAMATIASSYQPTEVQRLAMRRQFLLLMCTYFICTLPPTVTVTVALPASTGSGSSPTLDFIAIWRM